MNRAGRDGFFGFLILRLHSLLGSVDTFWFSQDRLISRSHIVSLFAPEGQRQMDSFRFQIIINLLLRLSLDFSIYSYEKGYMYKGVSSPDNVHKQLKHEVRDFVSSPNL